MANIKVNDIKSAGTELLLDSESFLIEITDEELNIGGGFIWTTTITTTTIFWPRPAE